MIDDRDELLAVGALIGSLLFVFMWGAAVGAGILYFIMETPACP